MSHSHHWGNTLQPVHTWSPTRKRMLAVVFLGLHAPLTVLAAASFLLSDPVGAMSLMIALLGTVLGAAVTLPTVYHLTADRTAGDGTG